ncbi:MAG: sulfotransferase [Phycisphaerales bacterium]
MEEGVRSFHAERFEEAMEAFARAVRADWRHSGARLFLARSLGMLGRMQECVEEIEKLAQIAGRNGSLLVEAGKTLEKFGLFEPALLAYERAIAAGGGGAEPLVRAASACERLHRLERAESLAREAMRIEGESHEAGLVLARVLRRAGRADEAVALLRDRTGRVDIEDMVHARLWYELAAVLDSLGQYAEAAAALTSAKACLAERARVLAPAAEEAEYTLRRLVQEMTPERVQAWIRASEALEPARVAALVGFPRSGTTLLERMLDAHPQVESVEESLHLSTELVTGFHRSVPGADSLAQVLDRISLADVRRCRARYLAAMSAHLAEPVGDRWLLDKNPVRTLMMPVLRRAVPGARIICALRDPRDVVLSNLMQSFEPSAMNLAFLDVARGGAFYALNMGGWLKLREMIDQWVEVRYERLVVDPSAEARRVLALLDLEWDDAMARFQEVSKDKAVRSPTYAAVREKVHTRAVRRFEHYAEYLAPAMPHLEPIIKSLGYD